MAIVGGEGTIEIDLGAGYGFLSNVTRYTLSLKTESLESSKQGDKFKTYRGDGVISGSGSIDYNTEFDCKADEVAAKQMLGFSFATGVNKEARARFTLLAGDPLYEQNVYIESAIILEDLDIDVSVSQLVVCKSGFKCTGPLRFVSTVPGQLGEESDYCIAIVEESLATAEEISRQWEAFRQRWPLRPFALLIVSEEGELLSTTVTGGELAEVDLLVPVSLDFPWDGVIKGVTPASDLAGLADVAGRSLGSVRVWLDGTINIEDVYDSIVEFMRKASLIDRAFTLEYYIADSYLEPFLN